MMICRIIILCCISFCVHAQEVNVNFHIFEEDSQAITPAMICITNLEDSSIVNYQTPTYPEPFYKGIAYSADRNWIGPVRKTLGPGSVNGQRTYVYGPNPSLPYWNEPVFYQVSGDFSQKLKPGRYRISIEHGNEYLPVSEEFIVKNSDHELQRSYLLKRWINLPSRGWYSGDVHTHHASHKPEFNEYMKQFARAEDVHLINILEMGDRQNTHFKASSFGNRSAICADDYCLVFGQEEPRSEYGHVIGLNTEAMMRDTARYNYYDIIFNKIHTAPEALAGFAHFAYRGEGVTEGMAIYAPTHQINFVELLQNTQLNKEEYYDYLNLGFKISAAAGSDFPWGSTIGDGRTFVYTGNQFSHQAWFKGLKNGNTFVSNGPALLLDVKGQLPGAEVKLIKGSKARITVKALSHSTIGRIDRVEIYNNDGLLKRAFNEQQADSLIIQWDHPFNKNQWVCAVVYCENSALAHTSPVYITDGTPFTGDSSKAVPVAKRLLKLLEETAKKEMQKPQPDKGIIQRIEQSKKYYRRFL